MADAPDDLGIPMKPARPIGSPVSVAPVARAPSAVPPRVPEMPRAGADTAEPTRRAVTEPIGMPVSSPAAAAPPPSPAANRRNEAGVRQLTVGREISLSGEIASCDTLIVEGSVEANLQNCRDVDIAESGLFKGSAEIENADVRGSFEGNLIVRKRLMIRAGGNVSGSIRYGQLEIELGGQICGDVQMHHEATTSGASDIIAELANARAAS
jgi:cytoskeletal protein CcmA (bactofilin family)